MRRRACVLAVVAAVGCSNDQLGRNAVVLLDSFAHNDVAAAREIADPALRGRLSDETFAYYAAVYRKLGARRAMTETKTGWQDGLDFLEYDLDFERGPVTFTITSRNRGLWTGFGLDGPGMKAATDAFFDERARAVADGLVGGDWSAHQALLHPTFLAQLSGRTPHRYLGKLIELERVGRLEEGGARANYRAVFTGGRLQLWIRTEGDKVVAYGFETSISRTETP